MVTDNTARNEPIGQVTSCPQRADKRIGKSVAAEVITEVPEPPSRTHTAAIEQNTHWLYVGESANGIDRVPHWSVIPSDEECDLQGRRGR